MNKLIIAFCVLAFFFALIEGVVTGDTSYATTRLTNDIAASSSNFTISVDSTEGFRDTGYIEVDNEVLSYGGKTDYEFTNCYHAAKSTTAAYHYTGTMVYSESTGSINAALGFVVIGTESNINVMSFGYNFITKTIPKLISFDYVFLDSGPLQYLRGFLLCISVGFIFMVTYMVLSAFGGILQSIFVR